MGSMADRFERGIEKFLKRDLDRRMRLVSWATLVLLICVLLGGSVLLRYPIRIKDADTKREMKVPLKDVLFRFNLAL